MRLSSLFRRQRTGTIRTADRADVDHLKDFARSRRGVEAFVEPRTTVTETTVVLVASDGEWTRRRVASARAAHELAGKLGIPAYDAAVVGYPARMREWTARQAREARAEGADGDGG
jgi:hypothetical protein